MRKCTYGTIFFEKLNYFYFFKLNFPDMQKTRSPSWSVPSNLIEYPPPGAVPGMVNSLFTVLGPIAGQVNNEQMSWISLKISKIPYLATISTFPLVTCLFAIPSISTIAGTFGFTMSSNRKDSISNEPLSLQDDSDAKTAAIIASNM
eukprot:NODE_56_length_25944_cov_0.235287.p14 type:complete len:147 gc:universal NODE_56_length_25944_cov_0.235287:18593-18153(-)